MVSWRGPGQKMEGFEGHFWYIEMSWPLWRSAQMTPSPKINRRLQAVFLLDILYFFKFSCELDSPSSGYVRNIVGYHRCIICTISYKMVRGKSRVFLVRWFGLVSSGLLISLSFKWRSRSRLENKTHIHIFICTHTSRVILLFNLTILHLHLSIRLIRVV